MRTILHLFPSVSLDEVNLFTDPIEAHARPFAHQIFSRNSNNYRTEEKIFTDTMQGSRAKVAACLSNKRDPITMIDWICVGGFSPGYMYLGEKESYVVQVKVEDITNEQITIAISKSKYENKIKNNIIKGSYANFTEFVTYEPDSKLYFHLGRISNENFINKEPVKLEGWNYIVEYKVSSVREDGLLVLS